MAQPDIIVTIGEGGLGRPLADKDHISGMILYHEDATLPAGFMGGVRIKTVFSLVEAEALGIVEGSADFGLLWYHIREYFRLQPKGELKVNIIDATAFVWATHDFEEITTLQLDAEGTIRQVGIIQMQNAFLTANVSAIQTVCAALRADSQPLSAILAPDISAVADLTTLTDLRTLASPLVSVVIGEDGAARGAALAVSETTSASTLGATLGAASLANVNESIAWVGKFNLSDGIELEVANFANGEAVKTKSSAFLDALNDKGYIFLRKFTKKRGFAGTYHNNSPTATVVSSDFAFLENNRTIDKATGFIEFNVLPLLNSPLKVQSDGTLFEETSLTFLNLTKKGLQDMKNAQEISDFEVIIDPTQNVLSTSTVKVTVRIIPVGVARNIEFTIGYALNLTA